MRIADQQQVIVNTAGVDSEQRLAQDAFAANSHARQERPAQHPHRTAVSHDELSEMIRTTGRRISVFMEKFRELGLMEINTGHCLVVNEKRSLIIWVKEPPGMSARRGMNLLMTVHY